MFHINIDTSGLEELEDIGKTLDVAVKQAAKEMSVMVHAKVVELANEKLKSRRKLYLDALSIEEEDGVFVINLDAKALWIEDGTDPHSMLDSLLASPKAKTAEDGCVLNPRNKVLTSLGWKRIKDIVPGDMVLTHSGKFREVKELLVKPTPLGTEYVVIKPVSTRLSSKCDNSTPSISLTKDHLVLTPNGWTEAGNLKKGDLIATPADLTRKCKWCQLPLPINDIEGEFCLNNRCSRQYVIMVEKRGFGQYSKEDRKKWSKLGNEAAKKTGCFDRNDWGAKDPKALKKMIEIDGKHWHSRPEQKERDVSKDEAIKNSNGRVFRVDSNEIYKIGERLARFVKFWHKNHSGELGVAWIKVGKIVKGTLNRRDHVYAKKYDICLEAEEHSFCCETIFIHNSKYLVVPFDHSPGQGPANTQPVKLDLVNAVKKEMKSRNIPWSKIEKDDMGRPKLGKLHKFSVMDKPLKHPEGPGQGKGPVGDVRQGPTGIPFLQGVNVYQNMGENGKVKRSVLTFRIASSKHREQNRWWHPGNDPVSIFDKAHEWALEQLEQEVLPAIISKINM